MLYSVVTSESGLAACCPICLLASLVAVSELTGEAMGLISLTYKSIPILITVAAIYLLLNTLMTTAQGYFERSLRMPR